MATSTTRRGFATMDAEAQRRIASKGGKAAHESGHAHEWDSREAAEAGRRGGLASHGERAAFHRESAAHHAEQAARYRSSGQHDRADLHAEQARSHGRQAEDGGRATSRGPRGFEVSDSERQREHAASDGRASPSGRGSGGDTGSGDNEGGVNEGSVNEGSGAAHEDESEGLGRRGAVSRAQDEAKPRH